MFINAFLSTVHWNMKVLPLAALFSLLVQLSFQQTIGYESPEQELRLYRNRVIIVDNFLRSECPEYIKKRSAELLPATQVHLDVEKQLYNALVQKLVECRAQKGGSTQRTTTVTTTEPTTTPAPTYRDCQEFYEHGYNQPGVYEINLPNLSPFHVWCDFFSEHGWTVIQRRENEGNVSFDRYWADYKNGFGDVAGEQWMGNDRIHALTQTSQMLNIKLTLRDGSEKNGTWTQFYISDESDNYRLTISGTGYTGSLVDDFSSYHNGMPFSTRDRDNDRHSGNCAGDRKDGWWYNACNAVTLNSEYSGMGMYWSSYGTVRASVMRVTR